MRVFGMHCLHYLLEKGINSQGRYPSFKEAITDGYSVTDALQIFLSIFSDFLGVFKAKFTINRTSAKAAGPRPQLTKNTAGLRAFWAPDLRRSFPGPNKP